jgi:hypothetical protein
MALNKYIAIFWVDAKIEYPSLDYLANSGNAYCAKLDCVYVEDPKKDECWDEEVAEFFGSGAKRVEPDKEEEDEVLDENWRKFFEA